MKELKKFLYLLTPEEQKKAFLLLVMTIIMALLEMIGVASILPFISTLVNPEIIETNSFLRIMFDKSSIIGVKSKEEFLFVLGFLVFIITLITICFKALTQYFQLTFTNMREYSISKKLVENYLHQPYSWFLNQNSSNLGKSILSEVSLLVAGGLRPLIELISKTFVAIAIIILLILINPEIALIAGLILGISFVLVYKFTRKYIASLGKDRAKANELRFTAVNEAFNASKDVKLRGLEKYFLHRFGKPAEIYSKKIAYASIIGSLPRYILEAIIFSSLLLMILYSISASSSFINFIPIISLYAVASYRLIPALQGIYSSAAQIKFAGPALDMIYRDIKYLEITSNKDSKRLLNLKNKITLRNICYSYPGANRTAIKNINLEIPAKTCVGLIGTTGSGKTTLVDIILGLLEVQNGSLEIDGEEITKVNSRNWQKSIGYVPQNIYLSDDTIMANIAFGVNYEDINLETIEKVSRIAKLHDFVINELPNKYQTKIGERGVRLSGGQRQRIGIARALYHSPQVLILDEATSALDNITEKAVMDSINNFQKHMTIVLIAHRLSTVKKCDKIYVLEKGEIKNEGTFDYLSKLDENFLINATN
jgi:ABC-type multidrug transport system fused ATPase/permease subunit